MAYDVFLSYPHADVTPVQAIVATLRARRLQVWFDESDIADFASITRSITEGLAQAKVLLTYYSPHYARSRACQCELTAAFLAAQQEGDPRQRILVINPEAKAEHIHPVELRDAKFRQAPALDDAPALEALAASIVDHVAGLNTLLGEIRALTPPSWYGTLRAVGSNRFVGRLSKMWEIHSGLQAAQVPIITNATGSSLVQLHGTGGMGKSLLAEEYALRFGAAYPGGVFWLSAFGHDDAKAGIGATQREAERTQQIQTIAARLGLPIQGRSPEEIEGHLGRHLEARGQSFLWIVDDFPSDTDSGTLRCWFAPHPLGRTLITLRTRKYDALGKPVSVEELDPDEAYQLLTFRRAPKDDQEVQLARDIAKTLGYHASAVDVAGGALEYQSFVEFWEELADPTEDALELAKDLTGQLPNDHEKSIAVTLLKSINLLGNMGRDFLRLASVLAVAPIPTSLVAGVFTTADGLDEQEGRRRARLALKEAGELSLARNEGDDQLSWSVHTLISRTIRFRDPQPERRIQLRASVVRVLHAQLSAVVDIRQHARLEHWVAHGRKLALTAADEVDAELLGWIARYDDERGSYRSAANLHRQQWSIRRQLLGEEHLDTLITMNNLAVTLQAQDDLAAARAIQEQVLAVRRQLLGEEAPSTLAIMNNLAETLRIQGDLAGARVLQEQVLAGCRPLFGEEHPKSLSSMNNLAVTLRVQGDLTAAGRCTIRHWPVAAGYSARSTRIPSA